MAQVQVQAQVHASGPPYASNNNNNNTLDRTNDYSRSHASATNYFDNNNNNNTGGGIERLGEDASDILVFVLNGGPKWGFRIKQLNDNRVIVSRIDRGPAERSGLRVYDEILSVNNVELLDSPRSLLLLDYPDQFSPAPGSGGGNPPSSGSLGERTPLLAAVAAAATEAAASGSAQASPEFVAAAAAAAAATGGGKIELSKLDFAYQLIKHSSASNNNKLVLSVRRFLDFAYARASALAASNMLTAWNFSSSNQYRPSIADLMLTGNANGPAAAPSNRGQLGAAATTASNLSSTLQQHRNINSFFGTNTRPHTSTGTGNVYKCCDCYCDKAASGQSEDEENERRLIERLKLENQQRQMRQLEEQQQQREREERARQQLEQQQQQQQVICFHDANQQLNGASLRRQSSGGSQQQQQQPVADKTAATSESEYGADEPAPQVPVRRSSRQASVHPITGATTAAAAADNRAPVYSLHHRRLIGLKARARPAPERDSEEEEDGDGELDYEEDDDDDDESLLPPPPRLHAIGPNVIASAASRPPLPPPPPPPPPVVGISGRRGKHPPPPPPPPRARSAQHAPKNIWSPSSSSLASSSLSSEPELELDPIPVATAAAQEAALISTASTAGSEGGPAPPPMTQQQRLPISQTNKGALSGASRSHEDENEHEEEEEEEDEQATIVERHLEGGAANTGGDKHTAGAGENELHHNKRGSGASLANDNNDERDDATSIKASASSSADTGDGTMARMRAGNKNDDGNGELPLPLPPPPIEHQERENLQLPKGNLRSFSISSPTNLTTRQQQQQQLTAANASHQLSSGRAAGAGLSSFVGGPSAGRSSRSPAGGQMRSFSIAAPLDRMRADNRKQVELDVVGVCQPGQTRREQGKVELGGDDDDDDEPMRAQISTKRTLEPQQQQQQPLRAEEQLSAGRAQQATAAAARQDHTAASARTTADRVVVVAAAAAPASGQLLEQTNKNRDKKKLGPSIEKEMATTHRGAPANDDDDHEHLLDQRLETTTRQESSFYESSKQQTTFTKSHKITTTKPQQLAPAPQSKVNQASAQSKEEWFKQMYKQMHRPVHGQPVTTAEKGLLEAVNQASQKEDGSAGCIKIKLKSPRLDHHFEPAYFSDEDLERRSASPAAFNGTKPGNICDYLPGQSSISQHERNLLLYHKLIDHINRVFSSVLVQRQDRAGPGLTSRSTNALASIHANTGQQQQQCQHKSAYYEADDYRARSHSMRRTSATRRRSSSGGRPGTLKKRKQLAQSRSGPQTPANASQQTHSKQTACSPAYHIRSARLNDETTTTTTTSGDEHEQRCVFNRLLKDDNQQLGYESHNEEQVVNLENDDDDDQLRNGQRQQRDPRKLYVAVQQGHDIPLKGLRKPAPQPNIYKDEMFDEKSINIHYKTPASRLLKMNTLNEFELNRIKKFYAQELASRRLQRSKSTRLNNSANASGKSRAYQSHQQQLPLMRPFRAADDSSTSTDIGPIIDLKRYNHALTAKRKAGRGRNNRSGADRFVAKFARAMYDFCAKNEGELSIKRGDLVETLEILEGNQWARVEDCQSGLQGLAPLSYLDCNIGCAVAKRDVVTQAAGGSRASSRMGGAESHLHAPLTSDDPTQHHRLLAMSKGEPIALIRRLDGHLYEASNTRQATGLVWSNDLEIIKQPPGGGGGYGAAPTVAPSGANYEAPRDLNYCADFTDDEDDDEDGGRYEDDEDQDDDDQMLVRCLRSICQDLDDDGGRVHHMATLSHARRQQPNHREHLLEHQRRRRTRSASGALNEEQQRQQQQQHNHYRAQQFCTMSKRQRQQVAAASCLQQRAAPVQRPSCNCLTVDQCGAMDQQRPTTTVARSSSSPQIAPLSVPHQLQQREQHARSTTAASFPSFCRARYAYKPRQRDELELVAGDILVVVQECDDGWLIGHSYTTKQMGTFPGNFVEPI